MISWVAVVGSPRESRTGRACLRILTWNLFHGRSVPTAGRELFAEFAGKLADWQWEVALLQEVPPWWPAPLAHASQAEQRMALTSRNAALRLRRTLARRWPDLVKSNGGGCNAILSRAGILEHRAIRLRTWPERRVAQLARLSDGTCVVNFHGSARVPLAEAELETLWDRALVWSGTAPLVLGGDPNLRDPRTPTPDVLHVARREVDHLFARGLAVEEPAERLDRRTILKTGRVELSDHVPLAVRLRAA